MTRRLLATYLSVTSLVVLVLGVPLALVFQHDAQHERTLQVTSGTTTLASLVDDTVEHDLAGLTVPVLVRRYAVDLDVHVVVVNAGGAVIANSDPAQTLTPFRRALDHAGHGRVLSGSAGGQLYVSAPMSAGGAVLATYAPTGANGTVRGYWFLIALFGAIALVVSGIVSWLLAQSVARPLVVLDRTAAAFGEGNLESRVPEQGPPEVRSVARSFNAAAEKLDRLLTSQADWVSDASHQLRTPLAALRLRLENLQQRSPRDVADVEAALAEVERLGRITDDLLALSRLDVGAEAGERVDIRVLVSDRVALWGALADERGVSLSCRIDGTPFALAGHGRVEQILDNLLSNALDASPAGETISVTAGARDGRTEIHVIDRGPGMTAEERVRAFDRFWQKRSGVDGTGLGLAIVRRLADIDHAEVMLNEADGGGIDATVRYPR